MFKAAVCRCRFLCCCSCTSRWRIMEVLHATHRVKWPGASDTSADKSNTRHLQGQRPNWVFATTHTKVQDRRHGLRLYSTGQGRRQTRLVPLMAVSSASSLPGKRSQGAKIVAKYFQSEEKKGKFVTLKAVSNTSLQSVVCASIQR